MPTFLLRVTSTAFLAPGSITPRIGKSNSFFKTSSAKDEAVLQATTTILTLYLSKARTISRE